MLRPWLPRGDVSSCERPSPPTQAHDRKLATGPRQRARDRRGGARSIAGATDGRDRGCPRSAPRGKRGSVLRLLLVCAGGALGSGARYLVSTWAARVLGADFPRGTILVNATGSFVLAALFVLPGSRLSPEVRLFLGAGVLGGFTTYSSFNTETLALVDQGSLGLAAANVALTVTGCLVAGLLGFAVGRFLAP